VSKGPDTRGTVVPASAGRWVQPPGMRGAWYSPHDAIEIQEHVLGAEDAGLAFREAVLMHELHEKLDATFLREDPPDGRFPFRGRPAAAVRRDV
jgi:hypothetical protein